MEQIIITKRNGNRVPIQSRRTATNVTSAKQNWTLNGDDTVDITVTSPFKQSYEIGDKITVFGRDYTLNRLSKPKKTGMHEFQYTLQFEGVQYDLLRATYDVTIDTTNNKLQDVQGDSLTGDLRRFLTVLIANANRVFPGKWRLGVCPDTASDITKTFGESDNCLSVLQSILGEFDESLFFDIAIDGGVYVLNILSKAKTLPITLEFGKGNGLYMLSRDNVSSANIVTRLKVYGSASNITSKYRADRLCLPGKSKGQSFIEKPEAVAKYGIFEGRKHFDNIKPTFTGHVQSVGDSVLEFIDPTISFDLNAKMADGVTTKYLIDGVAAKVHFNSGNLAGYEFEVVKYDHATHKITLRKFTDDRGDVFPSETSAAFQFRGSDGTYPGDEYKLVDIALPDELVNKAEADLAEEANKYYDQNSQPKVQYSLSVTKAFVEANFATDAGIVDVFIPGDYVPIKDTDIDVDKSVRIKSITRNVLDPYDYSLTLSDTVTSTSITNRVISDLIDIDKIITINNLKDPARARANWRSSREVLDMVFDPEGDYYTDKIKPNSIDTLALSVGAKSMQFGLTNTVFQPNYNGNPKILRWQGGVLTHYTINEESAVSWMLADGQITLNLDSQAFYIYARCNKSGQDGTIQITSTQHKVDEDANYYWFWIGVINSVDPDIKARSIALTYGFTMINGRFIKTGRIESADGETYFDLDNSEIGGRIVFNANGEQKTLEELGQEALSKARIFVSTPYPPYDIGDLWVDGKELRRCITAKASGETYNVNDWVIAVSYDNTKTTIDGGIVTSGTIQVAGDNQSILAGITGQGTAASSIRFWAGASFENRATAPYRVLQDGSFYATKANITGTINANAGSIGGFNISSGKIGYGSTSEQDTTTGLALLRDFIRFYNGNQRVLVGCLNSLGYPCNGLFELTGSMGTVLEVHHKHENTADEKMEYWYHPKALAVYGNQFNIGKVALFEKGYIGQAYTDILTSWIGITHKFHFTANTTSRLAVDLPTKTHVDASTSNAAVVFDLEIVCDRVMPNTVVLRSQTGGQMYDQNGNTVSTFDMTKGDSIKFRYYNGGWIIINRNY